MTDSTDPVNEANISTTETVVPVSETTTHTPDKGVIGDVADASTGGLFTEIKTGAFIVLILAVVLLGGGFYWYYNHAQAEINTANNNAAIAENSFNTEKQSFETQQTQNQNLLNQITGLQQQQSATQAQNDVLREQIQTYDYTNTTNIAPTKIENDVNGIYTAILNKLELDTIIANQNAAENSTAPDASTDLKNGD